MTPVKLISTTALLFCDRMKSLFSRIIKHPEFFPLRTVGYCSQEEIGWSEPAIAATEP